MTRIPMLNLRRQQEQLRPNLQSVVMTAIEEGDFLRDVYTTSPGSPFEKKYADYCGRKYVIGVGSGTAALQIALIAAGIGAGDEVITVPNSFFATTEVILSLQAHPVFVDIDPATHLIDIAKLSGAINARTRAVVPVHLYGNVVDICRLSELLRAVGREDIVVIEDCAHAAGARLNGQPLPLGAIGAFSFNPVKNIGGLNDAGAIVTDDDSIALKARLLSNHGRSDKTTHLTVGFNSRLSSINDRVLCLKLVHLDAWNKRRREIALRYDAALGDVCDCTLMRVTSGAQAAYHQYVVRTRNRALVRQELKMLGIETGVHYPVLIPDLDVLKELGYSSSSLICAKHVNPQIMSLPCYPELLDIEVEEIAREVRRLTRDARA